MSVSATALTGSASSRRGAGGPPWFRVLALLLLVAGVVHAQSRPATPALSGSWWERTDPGLGRSLPRSRFYTIRSDLPAEETKAYADLLDTMHLEYARLMRGLRQRGKAHFNVYMFSSRQDYLDTLRMRFGIRASGSAGMFFTGPRGSGLAFFTEDLPRQRVEHVIRHEGFHQMAHIHFESDLPPWVDEGLAEYFGESVVVGGTVIEGQMTEHTLRRVKALIEEERVIPFADLLSRDLRAWNALTARGQGAAQYAQASSMVHFLLWGEGGRLSASFSAYLRHLNDGRDSVSAFRMAFGGTDDRALGDFERRWRAFVAEQKPGSVRAAVDRLTFLAEGVLHLREQGVHPASIEALKASLIEAGFELEIGSHAGGVVLRAADESLYEVPADSIQDPRRPPALVFAPKGGQAPSRTTKGGAVERGADAPEDRSSKVTGKPVAPPPPPELSTRDLRPRDLRVSWQQGADGRWRADIRLK